MERVHSYRIYATNNKTGAKDWFIVQNVLESNATTEHFTTVLAGQGNPDFTVDDFEIFQGSDFPKPEYRR